MLVVTAFHPGDADQALRLSDWTRELGGAKGHELLLIRDTTCDPAISEQIRASFAASFDRVQTMDFVDHFKKWPDSPNAIFSMAARYIQANNPQPWLFCEPDCVPLKAGWLDLLWAEYQTAGKPFLGDFVSVEGVPDHMSGNGIYPGEIMKHAGYALIAGDVAWDVAAAAEIVPQMHRGALIHHAWKHGAFADWEQFEREVLAFKPECVLFHADKTGSLYPLLRERKNLQSANEIPTKAGASYAVSGGVPGPTRLESHQSVKIETQAATKPTPSTTFSIFIKSYPPDYPWLAYCLRSIGKFCSGFSDVVLVTPDNHYGETAVPVKAHFVPEADDGYLDQQRRKLYADQFSTAEMFLYVDSDTIFTRPVTPETYFTVGKIDWLMTPWADIETPWRPMVEKFLKHPVEFEFMRRMPFMVPRWLLRELRTFCEQEHGTPLDKYIMSQPDRGFSEFNILGAFAHENYPGRFNWINTAEVPESDWPLLTVLQKFSHGGLTPEIVSEFENILSGDNSESLQGGSQPTNKAGVAAQTLSETHENGESLRAQIPTVGPFTPWEDKSESLGEIEALAGALKNFCGTPPQVRAVRKLLHDAGVIRLDYRFKRRKGWRKKK